MTPAQAANALRQIADAVDSTKQPSKVAVLASLDCILASLKREAGNLKRVTGREQKAALSGVAMLADRLKKVSKTLNPQDPSRQQLEAAVDQLHAIGSNIDSLMASLDSIDI